MKKILTLLVLIIAFSGCRKGNSAGNGNNGVSCWQCAVEGPFNGRIVDIDTTICNMTQTQINDFMAPYNTSGQVITCSRLTP